MPAAVPLVEIADHVPAIPRELAEWGGGRTNLDDVFAERGPIVLNEDWRTGTAVFDLIARPMFNLILSVAFLPTFRHDGKFSPLFLKSA